LKCIGNGKTAECTEEQFTQGLEVTGKNNKDLPVVKCLARNCKFAITNEKSTSKECKASGILSVDILPLGGLGVWQVTTGSFNSIVNINSCIRSIIKKYGRAHALPLVLERRPQITTYQGKKTTHYTLHINTDKSITEMVRTAQIAPERVLIEAYGTEVAALPAPEEIMDSETVQETDKAITVNHPPVDSENFKLSEVAEAAHASVKLNEAAMESEQILNQNDIQTAVDKIKEDVKKYPADSPEKKAEYDKTTEKILNQFDGTAADDDSKKFLDGCKEDARKELGTDGNQDSKIVFPELFPKFMAFCKQQLEKAGKGDMYRDAFHLYSVKTAADLEKDIKKQGAMRKYLESLVEEEVGA
jgi:hypothetical protein